MGEKQSKPGRLNTMDIRMEISVNRMQIIHNLTKIMGSRLPNSADGN